MASDGGIRKGPVFMGREIDKMPCFKYTFLYGISAGLGMTLIHFLFTSKVYSSLKWGGGAYVTVGLGYWFKCNYEYANTKFEMARLQEAMRRKQKYDLTNTNEKKIDFNVEVVDK